MSTLVKGDGRLDSKIVLIGEAPGHEEVRQRRPFVGPSGFVLRNWLEQAGLKRSDLYIDNVYPYMAPSSKIAKVPKSDVEEWAANLHERMLSLDEAVVVVPIGNIALRALMRKPLFSGTSPKITDWRGSICAYHRNDGKVVKMIPTIHPAATFHDQSLVKLCLFDWRRIAADSTFPELNLPQYTNHIPPVSDATLQSLIDVAFNPATVMAVDIENPGKRMACVGFAASPTESFTLGWDEDWELIKTLCESPCAKVGQNFLFDRWWLDPPPVYAGRSKKYWGLDQLPNIKMGGKLYDLLGMHHVLDSTLPHDLATQASLYTRQPYWKRSWKDSDAETYREASTPFDKLCEYNGIDCCVTRQLFDVYVEMLGDVNGQTPAY